MYKITKKDEKGKYYPVVQMALFIHNIDEAEDDVLQEISKEFQKSRLG